MRAQGQKNYIMFLFQFQKKVLTSSDLFNARLKLKPKLDELQNLLLHGDDLEIEFSEQEKGVIRELKMMMQLTYDFLLWFEDKQKPLEQREDIIALFEVFHEEAVEAEDYMEAALYKGWLEELANEGGRL